MTNADTLAYFLDEEQLETTLPGWPKAMNLVLCLDAAGGWSFLVYHEQEIPTLMDRISSVLDRPIGAFAITPEVEGHPTRRVLFSEEQQLLTMLGRTDRLVETAQDYAINYNFALEEGLDPEEVTRRVPVPSGPLGSMRDGLRSASLEDRSVQRARPTESTDPSDPPKHYVAAGVQEPPELTLLEADLFVEDGEVIVSTGGVPRDPVRIPGERIAFREDFDRLLLPRELLGAEWTPEDAVELVLEEDALPPAMVTPLRASGGQARLAVTATGLYLGPFRPEAPAARGVPAEATGRGATPRWMPQMSWRARVTALVILCLVSGVAGVLLKDRLAPASEAVATAARP